MALIGLAFAAVQELRRELMGKISYFVSNLKSGLDN
jgi:hypothetical protein